MMMILLQMMRDHLLFMNQLIEYCSLERKDLIKYIALITMIRITQLNVVKQLF